MIYKILGSCRSTSARLVDNSSLSRRTNQALVNKLKNSRLKTLFKQIVQYFFHQWYVLVTYQPCAHKCNSCKRYVVVTYRSILCTFCKKHVSYTCNSGELIQIRTEQPQNKRIFIHFPYCKFISKLGAIFITNLTKYYINPPFKLTCAVIYI